VEKHTNVSENGLFELFRKASEDDEEVKSAIVKFWLARRDMHWASGASASVGALGRGLTRNMAWLCYKTSHVSCPLIYSVDSKSIEAFSLRFSRQKIPLTLVIPGGLR
jgi:hypothetical protein